MWRLWLLLDVKLVILGSAVVLFTLALIIHFVLLSTERYNWIGGTEPDEEVRVMPGGPPSGLTALGLEVRSC